MTAAVREVFLDLVHSPRPSGRSANSSRHPRALLEKKGDLSRRSARSERAATRTAQGAVSDGRRVPVGGMSSAAAGAPREGDGPASTRTQRGDDNRPRAAREIRAVLEDSPFIRRATARCGRASGDEESTPRTSAVLRLTPEAGLLAPTPAVRRRAKRLHVGT